MPRLQADSNAQVWRRGGFALSLKHHLLNLERLRHLVTLDAVVVSENYILIN